MFEQVSDLVRAMAPDEFGELRIRPNRRGLKLWFGPEKPPREHYEAQLLPRRYVDGEQGHAIEIGFHAENPEPAKNQATIDHLQTTEKKWRELIGPEAEVGVFYGADDWRRISEAWLDEDLDEPELPFEIASRVIDYVSAIEPARAR